MENKDTKILVLGDRGMLGHIVKRYLKEQGYIVDGLNREHCDFKEHDRLFEFIEKFEPDYVINCSGILITGKDINEFAEINIVLPRILQRFATALDFKLIHISTNCVFKDIGPHSIDETPDATNLYGMSKAFGEINDDKNLTIRTSIIGPELKNGSGLLNFVLNSGSEILGFTNAMWNGVTTLELAKHLPYMMVNNTGLINFYTEKEINKYELLCIINDIWKLEKKITAIKKENVHSSLLKGSFLTIKSYKKQLQELYDWYYLDKEEKNEEIDEALE